MKIRKHHNNRGMKQVKTGKLCRQVGFMAYRLNPNKFKKPMKQVFITERRY